MIINAGITGQPVYCANGSRQTHAHTLSSTLQENMFIDGEIRNVERNF
jgi:hypothetical protein